MLVDADVSLHFPAGTYDLKGLQLEGLAPQMPGDKPVVLTDGISLRFSGFPNGLEQMRLYAVGPLSQDKCLQVDVRHSFQTALSEDILDRIVQMGRTAAGTFVEQKGQEK
jgi:hypothetical protein